jgi:hypothetical protein
MRATLALLAWFVIVPTAAFAQAVIAGTVKDPSGAVLPGVVVEATSPALIEKVRTAVTDGTGQYRIEDLRPGAYTVTFSLQGFSTVRREGIELSGSFTATINADLKVGALAETVTVTGETPVVDVQSARREVTLNSDAIKSIPTVRSYNAIVVVVPGVVTNLNDTVTGTTTTQFPIHGGRNNEGRMTIDGLNLGTAVGGNQPASYVADIGNAQEITFTTSGSLGESETAGLSMNIVPKTGGNAIQGSAYFSGSGEKLQADNFTQELNDSGHAAPTPFTKVYDLTGAFGGPIKKDRLVAISHRAHAGQRTNRLRASMSTRNAGRCHEVDLRPDLSQPAYGPDLGEHQLAVTWQATARTRSPGSGTAVALPEVHRMFIGSLRPAASPRRSASAQTPMRVRQITGRRPTNRLMSDAGYGGPYHGSGNFERPGNVTRDLIRVVEQCATGCADNGNIPGLVYRSQDWGHNYSASYNWRGSAAYVTGAHSLKIGYQGTVLISDREWSTNNQNLTYRFNNGVPNQLTESISPWYHRSRVGLHALFAQEQWTFRRLTLQGALRFDRASSWFLEQQAGPSRFLPVAITFPKTDGVNSYKDLTPRMGAAYDLFGNGKTALKLNVGKYLEGAAIQLNYINPNPMLRMPSSTSVFGTAGVTRTWTDANGNFQPDCDLLNRSPTIAAAARGLLRADLNLFRQKI